MTWYILLYLEELSLEMCYWPCCIWEYRICASGAWREEHVCGPCSHGIRSQSGQGCGTRKWWDIDDECWGDRWPCYWISAVRYGMSQAEEEEDGELRGFSCYQECIWKDQVTSFLPSSRPLTESVMYSPLCIPSEVQSINSAYVTLNSLLGGEFPYFRACVYRLLQRRKNYRAWSPDDHFFTPTVQPVVFKPL